MKIRSGFVSNSSSASFIVPKAYLTSDQIKGLLNPKEAADKLGISDFIDCIGNWDIHEDEKNVWGDTWMDNFCYAELITKLGIDWGLVGWWDSNLMQRRKLWEGNQRAGKFKIISRGDPL